MISALLKQVFRHPGGEVIDLGGKAFGLTAKYREPVRGSHQARKLHHASFHGGKYRQRDLAASLQSGGYSSFSVSPQCRFRVEQGLNQAADRIVPLPALNADCALGCCG